MNAVSEHRSRRASVTGRWSKLRRRETPSVFSRSRSVLRDSFRRKASACCMQLSRNASRHASIHIVPTVAMLQRIVTGASRGSWESRRIFIWGSDRNPSQIKGPAAGFGGSSLPLTWQHPWRGRFPEARRPGAAVPSASPAAGRRGPDCPAASPRSASAWPGRRAAS